MPLFNTQQPDEVVIKEKIANTETSVIFDSEMVPGKIAKQLAGYEWKVDYYSLIAGTQDFKSDYDAILDTPTTQYVLIKDLVLYLDSPLSNVKPNELSVEAYVVLDYVPKLGDIVAAKLVDGRLILFKLTEATRDNYNLLNIYRITLKTYLIIDTPDDPVLEKLKNKVSEVLYYNKDFDTFGEKQLYTEEQVKGIETIRDNISKLVRFYSVKILRPEYKYYPIYQYSDELTTLIYDPYLETYMLNILGRTGENVKVNTVNFLSQYRILNESIFGLLGGDNIFKEQIKSGFKYDYPDNYVYNPFLSDIGFTYMDRIILLNDTVDADIIYVPDDQVDSNNFPTVSKEAYVFDPTFYQLLNGEITLDDVELTLFEESILKMLNDEPIDTNFADTLAREVIKLSNVQIYYFLPIVIHISLYSIYSYATNKL